MAVPATFILGIAILCTGVTSDNVCGDDHSGTTSGTIVATPGPGPCQWSIEVPRGSSVQLTFDTFHLHDGDGDVIVYEHCSVGNQLGIFKGFEIPQPVTSYSNKMVVVLTSSGIGTGTGFRAHYEAVPVPRVVPGELYSIPDDPSPIDIKQGCLTHTAGERWATEDKKGLLNCVCGGDYRVCYTVRCLAGTSAVTGKDGHWACRQHQEKQGANIPGQAKFVPVPLIVHAVVGLVNWSLGNAFEEPDPQQQILADLQALDNRLDDLHGQLDSLQTGQDWAVGATLYAHAEQRLRDTLDYLTNVLYVDPAGQMQPSAAADQWADTVLSTGQDGLFSVLNRFHDMVVGSSGLFGTKSLLLTYDATLVSTTLRDSVAYWNKLLWFYEYTYSLQVAGYSAWSTALNVKGRQDETSAVMARARGKLSEQACFLEMYLREWPAGTYGLPMTNSGCPVATNITWETGSRYQDTSGYNEWSDGLHFPTDTFHSNNMRQEFCMKTSSEGGSGQWPAGNYCIFKKGACADGFHDGHITWDDQDVFNDNEISGALPDGVYDANTEIHYCCREDGSYRTPIRLPILAPFYLFRHQQGCQMVEGVSSPVNEWFWFDDDDWFNHNELGGAHPYDDGDPENHRVHYCFYQRDE
nr:ApeC-containing protein 5 [Branchiostoma floridae]